MESHELKTMLDEFKADLLKQVDAKNSGLAASIQKDVKKSLESSRKPTEASPQEVDVNALQSQIETLRTQLEAKDRQAFESRRGQALKGAIAQLGVLNPESLSKLYLLDHGDALREEGDSWVVEQGDKSVGLEDSLRVYLDSTEGKIFAPASGTNGAASAESRAQVPPLRRSPSLLEACKNFVMEK